MMTLRPKTTLTAVVVGAALALAADPASAQNRPDDRTFGVWVLAMVGYQAMDVEELNDRLATRGIPTFADEFITLGGMAQGRFNRLLLSGEGQLLLQKEEATAEFERTLTGAFGILSVGYALPSPDRLLVYPFVGIGGGGLSLTTREREELRFNEVLDEPGRSSELVTANALLQVGIGVHYLIKRLAVGVKAGYRFAPGNLGWLLEGEETVGGPDVGIDGPFIHFAIGAGIHTDR